MSFEQFSEVLENVPPELERNFILMTELDKRTEEFMHRINECVKEYEETRDKSQRDNLKLEVLDLFEKLSSFADDKIEKAEKTYDMIDKNIKKLTSLGIQATGGVESPMPIGFDMPLDPNEPKYCTCQGISYGDMIGCDNKECPIEWFHYPCVGLETAPRGKWYCQQCIEEWKKRRKCVSSSKKRKHH